MHVVWKSIRYIAVKIVFFARHEFNFLIRVIMASRKDQRNRGLKQAAQCCSKLADVFKKSKPSKQSKELFASENQDIASSNLESEG